MVCMRSINALNKFYDEITNLSTTMLFLPYTSTYNFLKKNNSPINFDSNVQLEQLPDEDFSKGFVNLLNNQRYAQNMCIFLTPILLPLTSITFILGLALRTLSELSKLITYPIAINYDYCF